MKKLTILFAFLLIEVVSCKQNNDKSQDENQNVHLSGKILNFNQVSKEQYIKIYVYDIGLAEQIEYPVSINDDGTFEIDFNISIPQDIRICYKTSFQAIVHPRDSLYVEFDAQQDSLNGLLKQIKYKGNSAELNSDLADYLQEYNKSIPSFEIIRQRRQCLSPEKYRQFWDSIRDEMHNLRNRIIDKTNPSEELKIWIYYDIEMEYFNNLLAYTNRPNKQYELKRKDLEEMPFGLIDTIPKIDSKSIINTKTLNIFTKMCMNNISSLLFMNNNSIEREKVDSSYIAGILNYTKNDALLRELILSTYFNNSLEMFSVSIYENNTKIIDKYITSSYLKEPLTRHYQEIKKHFGNPEIPSNATLFNLQNKETKNLYESIIEESKGKVTFIDCWGTWCSACIAEFPYSKEMIKKYRNKDVSFVFLCFYSDVDTWKAMILNYGLGGNHYLLDKKQSKSLEQQLKISGYPHYILFDKEGKIVNQGNLLELGPSKKYVYDLIDKQLGEASK